MTAESDQSEHINAYGDTREQRLQLVGTIAAMANTAGGTIRIAIADAEAACLEASRITQLVNEHVAPRVHGIETVREGDGAVVIRVPGSDTVPHVFTRDGLIDDDIARPVFFAGQIWIRDKGVNRTAGGQDIQRMVREAASELLERLSIGLRDPSFSFQLTESSGIPVHLAEDEEAVPVSPNLARLYPYTTKTLARQLGKTTNWVATASKVLRLKDSRENAYGVPSAGGGRVLQWRYSEHALDVLRQRVAGDPTWNPYHHLLP